MPTTRRATRPSSNGDTPLVASITAVTGRSVELGEGQNRPWQTIAWDYWGRLPELHFPTTQLARLLTRMDWNVTVDQRTLERTDDDTPDEVDEFLDAVTDGVGRVEAIRLLALNLLVPAECWYVQEGDAGWNVVSILDPRLRDIRDREDWIRLHVKLVDPRDRRYALGPFHSILGPAEELLTLEALSRAQSRSRIAQAGILFRPQSAQFPSDNPDDPDSGDSFADDLMAAMTAPIRDEHDASALVPLDLEVPDDSIEKFRHLTFDRPYDDHLHERIEQVVKRIAVGLDIPAEVLLGTSELNHWSAWLIDEQMGKNHAVPLADRVGEVLASAAEQLLDPDRPEGWITVEPDPAELFAKRSTVQDAFRAIDRGVVGLDYARDAIGAKPEDAPTADDLDVIMMLRGRNAPDAAGSTEGSAEDDAGPDVEPAADQGPPDEQGSPVAAALPTAGASEAELRRFGDDLADIDHTLRANLIGAMAIAVANARRRVGAKIRTAIRTTPEHDGLEDVDNGDLAAALGSRAFELVDVEETVRDTFLVELAGWWRAEVEGARRRLASVAGIDTSTVVWVEQQDASVGVLVDRLVEWTVSQVTRRGGEMHAVPAGLARDVVAVAGGSP